jgi:prepilin peptidase CpaA
MTWDLLPLVGFAPILVLAGLSDLRRMRIPNWTSLAAIAIFLVCLPLIGWPEAGWRIAAAAALFAVGLGAWALRLFGAGDVKLLSALLLLVPSQHLWLFWEVFAASLALGLIAVTGLRATGALRQLGWVSMRAAGCFPMGVSIALAGTALPAWIALA